MLKALLWLSLAVTGETLTENEVTDSNRRCKMRFGQKELKELKTNLLHGRVIGMASLIASVLVGTAPQSGAPQAAEIFIDPTGETMPATRTLAPRTAATPAMPLTSTVKSSTRNNAFRTTPKIALALGGGGMRGAAHVGVIKALLNSGIHVDMIAGTSMGAIVGGLYSAGVDVGSLEKKFVDGSLMKSFMPLPLKLTLVAAPVMAVPKTIDRNDYDGLYSGRKFRKYLDRSVPEYQQNIESLPIPFAAVALNLVDGKTYALRRGNLGAALQASSAVPGLCEPVRIGDQLFVDGGVVDNIPVDVARSMGADIVIGVNVNERFDLVPPDGFKSVGSVAKRLVTLQLASDAATHMLGADFIIHPNVDGIGLTSTKIKDARGAIEAGEKSAWAVIPSIKNKLKQAEN
ncbi:hypothetical protein BH10CYA1_BH10CYA1_40180 [soil metagenome]